MRTLEYKDVGKLPFRCYNWNNVVRVRHKVELAVHECLIEVEDKRLAAQTVVWLGSNYPRAISVTLFDTLRVLVNFEGRSLLARH